MARSKQWSCETILAELKKRGKESHRKTYLRHGAPPGNLYGVPIGELKPIQKQIKKDHQLALDLYATGNSDAMYLAALIADEAQMSRSELSKWAREAGWSMIESAVAAVAAESSHAIPLARKWIASKQETIAAIGWTTMTNYASVKPDEEIDVPYFRELLERVAREIHSERNSVKNSMNGFVIAAGCFVIPLRAQALKTARKIGKVEVDQGDTACKVPDATEYILKVEKMGRIGKKRKSARC